MRILRSVKAGSFSMMAVQSVSARRPVARTCRHARSIAWIARDRFLDAPIAFESSFHEREIDFLNAARGELLCEIAVSGISFRDEQHAAREAIETMHDARAQIAADGRERREPVQQRVHHGASMDARARMHHHAGGFVDRNRGGVLIENREREIFGLGPQRRENGGLHFDLFRPAEHERGFYRRSGNAHAPFANP